MERQFEIIGEAMTKLAKPEAPMADHISQYQRMIAFRNLLIHGYADTWTTGWCGTLLRPAS